MSNEVNQWTANQQKFLLWLMLPSRERVPLSQQMLAKELGVREETLSRWKQLPGFEEERLRLIRESIGREAHEIMGSFIDEAKKGQFSQQRTWLEMMGWYTPTQNQNVSGEAVVKIIRMPVEQLTDDDE